MHNYVLRHLASHLRVKLKDFIGSSISFIGWLSLVEGVGGDWIFLGAQTVGVLGAELSFWGRDGKFWRFLIGGSLEDTTGVLVVVAAWGVIGFLPPPSWIGCLTSCGLCYFYAGDRVRAANEPNNRELAPLFAELLRSRTNVLRNYTLKRWD